MSSVQDGFGWVSGRFNFTQAGGLDTVTGIKGIKKNSLIMLTRFDPTGTGTFAAFHAQNIVEDVGNGGSFDIHTQDATPNQSFFWAVFLQ